ncbi:MAG TPA: HAD-IB family hydrolase [Frankiaceae bacterium]|nr:HAD-IB family hydrolase [Frankiaceae bacterium]
MTGAAFFDLDKTVIAKSSTLAFGRPFYQGGLVNRRAVLKSTYAQFVYLIAGADEDQMDRMRAYLQRLCTGWDAAQVRAIVEETLHDLIDPLVYDEAVSLIEEHRAAGRRVVIVSSSGEEVVGPIGELVGADEVVATRMVVADGKYTGEIEFYAYGPQKAEAMRALAAEHGWDLAECYAYSDSMTDLPMLEAVGHPVAVNPDKALRRVATERGWPVREFRRPVSLASRIAAQRPAPRLVAGAAVVGGAAAIGWHLYARRRRAADTRDATG